MRIGMLGTGHVGLPTAAAFAHIGHEVVATDIDAEKRFALREGRVPFHESGLDELVEEGLASRRLSFSADPADAIRASGVVFICVGTPARADGEANLLAVERAAELVARHATRDVVVVEKSTVPAGTAGRIRETLVRRNGHVRFAVVSNPEFLREGTAVEDSLHPARVLVGSDSVAALAVMREVYGPLVDGGTRLIETDLQTAELAKHACNAFLAMKISYANALARICELAGADVVSVAEVMGTDPRIGRAFLDAGLGYGGYCFPKDLAAFRRLSSRLGYEFELLQNVERINDEAVEFAFRKIERALWNMEEKRVALLGLAFKPGTDDLRMAPALSLAQRLLDAGAEVVGYDPMAGAAAGEQLPRMAIASDLYEALTDADCAVVCTDWPQIREMDLGRARALMAQGNLVDGRNMFDPAVMAARGFSYFPTGRPPS